MILKQAIEMLGNELSPEVYPGEATPEYRRVLAQCLLYRVRKIIL